MTDRAWFAPARPRVLAHRGLATRAPENTLPAFQAAWDAGARYLETDTHVSADGVAVLCHDPDLRRIAGRPERVADMTAAELQALDLGGGTGVATLAELLRAFPDARLNIDVKAPGAVEPTVRAVRAAGAAARVLITSFDEHRRRAALALLPGAATSAGRARILLWVLLTRLRITAPLPRLLAAVDALQVPERQGPLRIVDAATVRAAHAAGVEVHVWTVNDPDAMRRLLAAGVDGLITDRCDLAIPLVRGVGSE